MYSQIVVPLDGGRFSQRAIGPATRMAVASDAKMLLVAYAHTDSHRRDLEAALAELDAASYPCPVRTKVEVVGDIAASVVAEVDAEPGSLVCMSSVGRSRSEPVIGSVAAAVLRDVSTPVLLVGPAVDVDRFHLAGTMDVGIDDSTTSHAIVPIAASWAIVYGLGLRVVTVLPRTTSARDLDPAAESAYVRRVAAELEHHVEKPVDFEVLHGDAATCIVDDVARNANLLAVATHGRTGLQRLAAGSVAMELVHRSPRPVLMYRPEHLR